MSDSTFDLKSINWNEYIPSLYAFADELIKAKQWFRGPKAPSFIAGKEVNDYVYEAIARFLKEPEKFRPEDGTLLNYLKLNVIKSLVGADAKRKENKVTRNVVQIHSDNSDDEDSASYEDSIGPAAEAFFDDEIDFKKIMSEVETIISGDPILENIYLGVKVNGLKRREVIKEFEMTEQQYDNGVRRLETILKNVAKKFNL